MVIQKSRMNKGRHPLGFRRDSRIMWIEELVKSIDRWARVLPERFHPCRSPEESLEVIHNPRNKRELFLKLKLKTIMQKIKIECTTLELAEKISLRLK